uniref:Uncharacterized protein n=1 Tax=Poecilia latipinna TaxID=48699 RepID=A0A3B3UYA0_9TELE
MKFSCSICLDLLKDPVTIPCGHSYCMNCIKCHWDEEEQRRIPSCPQCRKEFIPKPGLEKSIMLAELVEELKKTGLQAAPADHCYAGPEDVACDVCTGRKRKAVKSCLSCSASYCQDHLQPHYDVPELKKHKLVDPSKNLKENICSRHDEVMKIFCRTDQQCICYLCTMDEHKGHETVPAAAERDEKQKKLQKYVKLLQQEVEVINRSADKTVEDSEKIFTELIRLLQKRSSDVKQQIRSQQETEVSRVKDVQEKLEQEITELKRKDAELEQLSITEDHNQFLLNYPSLPALRESTHSSRVKIQEDEESEDEESEDEESEDEETEDEESEDEEGGRVYIAVSYKSNRKRWSEECQFGSNDKSWSLCCGRKSYTFHHNKVKTPVPGPVSSRIGVYLDHRAGILCFYSVSETMTLIYRVQTTFTQPLHAGIGFDPSIFASSQCFSEFIQLKQLSVS